MFEDPEKAKAEPKEQNAPHSRQENKDSERDDAPDYQFKDWALI